MSFTEEDRDFVERQARYFAHMRRFAAAHTGARHSEVLRELERRDRWVQIMGKYADVLKAPEWPEIEAELP